MAKSESQTLKYERPLLFRVGLCLLSILTISLSKTSLACDMTKEDRNEIYINPDFNFLHYGSKSKSAGPITTEIVNCRKSEGKYLVFSLGLKKSSLISDVSHLSYDGRLISDKQCSIKYGSAVFPNMTSLEEKFQLDHQKQFKVLRSCLQFRIRDIDKEMIQFSPNQATCRVTPGPDSTFALDGNYCYIKVNPRTHLQVAVEVKQDCRDSKFLVANSISAQDLNIVANTWISGDESGQSHDLEYVRSFPIKMSLLPSKKLFPLADNNIKEEIQYPSSYNVSLEAGPIQFQKVGAGRFNFDFSLAVNNQGPESCVPGKPCSSNSNFNMPVGGEIQLSEVNADGTELVRRFPFLAVAPPQFQGILKNTYRPVIEDFEFKPGSKYQVTFTMTDPVEDFRRAQVKINSIKFELPKVSDSLPNIPSTPTMGNIRDFKVMDALPSGMTPGTVDSALSELNRILKDGKATVQWPQAFETVCSARGLQNCVELSRVSEVFNISVEFQAGKIDPNTNLLNVSDIVLGGESALGPLLRGSVEQLPSYVCGGQ
ncbi:MAG: hypothetical protein JNM39_04655 [Bdellovibrionaceae bacterium]|nr:hypothetical protein [Pseudobdellovibrionaceae bacterium]